MWRIRERVEGREVAPRDRWLEKDHYGVKKKFLRLGRNSGGSL